MTFLAKYASVCPGQGCEDPIDIGDIVEWVEGHVVHEGCMPPPEVKPRPVCTDCWMEVALNGSCSCPS